MDYPISTDTIVIPGNNGDDIQVYSATPHNNAPRGGIVLIHHLPGWDRWSKEVARRFAVDGYNVLAPNLYSREAPGAEPDDAAAVARAQGGVPDEQVIGDVAGAAAYLRALPNSNGKVAAIGHCSGGRHTVLSACNIELDAAVNCYGGFVIGNTPEGMPVRMVGLEDQLPNLRCPMLGLFGNEDSYPSPAQVDTLRTILTDNGKEFEFHQFDNAGHGFFAADRSMYRVEAAVEAYTYISAFFQRTIG